MVPSLNKTQRNILVQFKTVIADCQSTDNKNKSDDYLTKWLTARDFNLENAEAMFRKSMEWRKEKGIDNLLHSWKPPIVLEKYYSNGVIGYDKFGCNVSISALGRTDMRGLLKSVSKEDYVRYIIYIGERNRQKINPQTGKRSTQETLIIDLDQLSYSQISNKSFAEVGLEIIRLTEANYPETVRRVNLINVPRIFSMAFSMVKPLLSETTLNKIRIFGFNRSEWQAALLEEIDSDQLPACYGGSMTDPDGNPMCHTKMNWGGEVPRSYYLSDDNKEQKLCA